MTSYGLDQLMALSLTGDTILLNLSSKHTAARYTDRSDDIRCRERGDLLATSPNQRGNRFHVALASRDGDNSRHGLRPFAEMFQSLGCRPRVRCELIHAEQFTATMI